MNNLILVADRVIDTDKISYIGKIDYIINHGTNTTLYSFPIVVDGAKIDISSFNKEEVYGIMAVLRECIRLPIITEEETDEE